LQPKTSVLAHIRLSIEKWSDLSKIRTEHRAALNKIIQTR